MIDGHVITGMNLTEVIAFLELLVFSAPQAEHEAYFLRVLNRLQQYGLKLAPSKYKIFQTPVKYMGHTISPEGICPDKKKTDATATWSYLSTSGDFCIMDSPVVLFL